MEITMGSVLPDAAREAAFQYLEEFDRQTYGRGDRYFLHGAVGAITLDDSTGEWRATVRGTRSYEVVLSLEEDEWLGECTCPVSIDCKHCCATMLNILALETAPADTAASGDPGGAGGKKRAKSPKRAAPEKPSETFREIAEAKLGRKLRPGEAGAARAIQHLFAQYKHSARVAESLLDPLTGNRSRWGWDMWEIWPTAPRNIWEAWLYLAHCLRQKERQPLPFLQEITSPIEVEALVAGWQRLLRMKQWRSALDQHAQLPDDAPVEWDFRLRLQRDAVHLEARAFGDTEFAALKKSRFDQLLLEAQNGRLQMVEAARPIWQAFQADWANTVKRPYAHDSVPRLLNRVLRTQELRDRVVNPAGDPFHFAPNPLRWRVDPAESEEGDYRLALETAEGAPPPPLLVAVNGRPSLYVTADTILEAPPLHGLSADPEAPNLIPAPALETSGGVALFDRLGLPLPPRLAGKVRDQKVRVVFRCILEAYLHGQGERLIVEIGASPGPDEPSQTYTRDGWSVAASPRTNDAVITRADRSAQRATPAAVEALRLTWSNYSGQWERQIGKKFPDEFADWLARLPEGIEAELDPLLASFRGAPLKATVKLEVEESGIDWFDLRVVLDVSDTEFTPEELKALLDAKGGFVRLGKKGWQRLQLQLSAEDEAQLADLGLNARDFSSEPQRLHALQLAGKKHAHLLPDRHVDAIRRRAEEIQTRVVPAVPDSIQADLRPYQVSGFHFLAYLSTNRFGGILADDMGLGKTVQALTWLAWLGCGCARKIDPCLVVCPKSVVDNWQAEAARFFPTLRVRAWRASAGVDFKDALREADLLVINYTQLRLLEPALIAATWHTVILDEAQFIKNPESQTARIATALRTTHRLALSGTPIENRLLDLWSIMAFAMPGLLGPRARFAKTYDQRTDPLARRRLAARVRPFVLRRTKSEVAPELPDRIEEDLLCELEGEQATLYTAELKRARQHLLRIKTSRELDKARFNILTSLLRLRQICCHPALVGEKFAEARSAKVNALLDLLEPLVEEGHKVLVFSQFVEMLALIREKIAGRGWRDFLLTGETENRGALVEQFQGTPGAAVFLISLRAGGFGLNLTAASYVVLFDPWWNPAVENQAIDRTHRIGQTSKVIAYRLLMKASIEEKIRRLQKQKSALAADILGEESFARGLTLDDFHFLLGE